MLISAPTEPQFSSTLSAKLRTLPALIDVYVLIVDRVMREHGFDQEMCQFKPKQNLLNHQLSLETSAKALRDCLALRVETQPKPEQLSRYKPKAVNCESDLVLMAV